MRLLYCLEVALVICLFITNLKSQDQSTLYFNLLDREVGLSSDTYITGGLQDSEGLSWFGTFDAGLNRFDGRNVIVYRSDPTDSTTLMNDQVLGGLFEDKNKNIWFNSAKSIECYQRKKDEIKHYELAPYKGKKIEKYLGCYHLERDTFLWGLVGIDKLLYRYNIFDPSDQKILGKTVFDIDFVPGVLPNGQLKYFFSIDGSKSYGLELFEFDEQGNLIKQSLHFDDQSETLKLNVHSAIFKNEKEVWLSTTQGLYLWDLKHPPVLITSVAPPIHHSILLDSSTLLINQPDIGFLSFNTKTRTTEGLGALLLSNPDLNIKPMLKKPFLYSDNILWVEYQKKGLLYCNPSKGKFKHLPKSKIGAEEKNYSYQTLFKDKKGNFWYVAYPIGLVRSNKEGEVLAFYDEESTTYQLPSKQVFEIFEDSLDNIWISTDKGVSILKPGTTKFENILDEQQQIVSYVTNLLTLSDGTFLALSLSKGLYQIVQQGSGWQLQRLKKLQNSKGYTSIYQDSSGQVYIGFDNRKIEVYQWKKKSLNYIRTLDISGLINGYYEDKNNRTLWVATSEGLVSIDKNDLGKKHIIYNQKNGLLNYSIQSIAGDEAGNIWLGTKGGLTFFNPQMGLFRVFSKADGAISKEYHAGSILTEKDGTLRIGGSNGITLIKNPSKIKMSEQPASIQITDFKINDELPNLLADTCFVTGAKHINEMEYLKLPPTKNTISFHFIAIDFSDPNATQLKYRLEPYDKTWVVLSKGEPGFSRYSNLPSGDYTLKIMGANSDGFWHDNAYKTLKIRVEPKLIEQLWFQLFLGLLGIFIIGLIYTLRVRQIKEKAILKTRAAENKMAALRAQMNPHFAFNSLQSINGFIAKNDMLGAFEYVSQFSDLMRMILENSRQNRISLEQEINLLELYLEIEALRFANPFEFDIDIAEDIDTFGIQIPAMLLQPFVENSIKHGLFHKKEKGKLQISFSKENSFLKCIIEDDGIGRDQAKKLNKQRGRKHKSRGLEIIKEQLDILRQSGFGKAYVEIIDLYADNKESIGTRVELLLPV